MATLDMEVSSIYSDMIQHGRLHSTATVQRVGQLCARELAIRARFVETHLFRVTSETLTELPEDLAEALKAEGKLYIHEDALVLRDYAQQKADSAYQGHALLARVHAVQGCPSGVLSASRRPGGHSAAPGRQPVRRRDGTLQPGGTALE